MAVINRFSDHTDITLSCLSKGTVAKKGARRWIGGRRGMRRKAAGAEGGDEDIMPSPPQPPAPLLPHQPLFNRHHTASDW